MSEARRTTTPTSFQLIAECSAADLSFVATMNGFPVLDGRDGEGLSRAVRLNAFIVEGTNVLRIRASAGAPATARLDLDFVIAETDQPKSRHVAWNYRYQAARHPLPEDPPMEVATHAFDIDRGLARWDWERARPYRGEPDIAAVRELLDELRRRIDGRDAAGVIELYAMKLTEQAIATGRAPDAVMADMRRILDRLFDAPGFTLLAAPGLQVEAWSMGKLVQLRGHADLPLFTLTSSEVGISLDTVVSNIDGQFRFAR